MAYLKELQDRILDVWKQSQMPGKPSRIEIQKRTGSEANHPVEVNGEAVTVAGEAVMSGADHYEVQIDVQNLPENAAINDMAKILEIYTDHMPVKIVATANDIHTSSVTPEMFAEYVMRLSSVWQNGLMAGIIQRINLKDKATDTLILSNTEPFNINSKILWGQTYFELEISDLSKDALLSKLEEDASSPVDGNSVKVKPL